MKVGGIYFLDGRHAHAGGNLGHGEIRCHLVLDFDPDIPVEDLFFFPEHDLSTDEMEFVQRPELGAFNLEKLIDGLAGSRYSGELRHDHRVLVNTIVFTHDFDTADVYDSDTCRSHPQRHL